MEQRKTCKDCGMWKPLGDFYKQDGMQDGRRPCCKKCHNKRRTALRKRNPEATRAYDAARQAKPQYKERKADAQRLQRFLRRMAEARTKGVTPNGRGLAEG
jgi:hypothetical protein